jgi:DNA-binding NarL/FixJ family response regulator
MRVLLADDEPKVRSALRLILEQLQEIESVEEVNDAQSLADRMQDAPPDLLLVDWELPGLHPLGTFSEMRRRAPLKVIVLSGRCPAPQAAISSGADACVSKCESPDRLFATLRAMGAD